MLRKIIVRFKDVMEHAENKTKGMIWMRDFDLLLSWAKNIMLLLAIA